MAYKNFAIQTHRMHQRVRLHVFTTKNTGTRTTTKSNLTFPQSENGYDVEKGDGFIRLEYFMIKTSRPLACFMLFTVSEYFRSSHINLTQTLSSYRSL